MPTPFASTPTIVRSRTLNEVTSDKYDIQVYPGDGSPGTNLTPIVTKIEWSYDLDNASVRTNIELVRTYNWTNVVKVGYKVRVRCISPGINAKDIIGIIMDVQFDSSQQIVSLEIQGMAIYLTNNKGSHSLVNETASDFIKKICRMYGIPIGNIAETGIKLNRELFMNRDLWDMMVTTLTYTRDSNPDARFILDDWGGSINLRDLSQESDEIWWLQAGDFDGNEWVGNIIRSVGEYSITNFRNYVKVFSREGFSNGNSTQAEILAPSFVDSLDPETYGLITGRYPLDIQNDALIKEFGLFSESVDYSGSADLAVPIDPQKQAKLLWQRLSRIQQTATITAVNIPSIYAGDPIYVVDTRAGLDGRYYVKSGHHVVTADEATMDLTIQYDNVLPAIYKARFEQTSDVLSQVLGSGQ